MLLALALAILRPQGEEIGETVVTAPRSDAPGTETGADRVVVTVLCDTGERYLSVTI